MLRPEEIDRWRVHPGQRRRTGDPARAGEALRGDEVGRGGELFRLNCASCHNFTGQGGALSQGKYAPILDPASEEQIYAAMLSGPENMPKFADGQLAPDEKREIIAYIKSAKAPAQPGRQRTRRLRPGARGPVAFLVGIGAIIGDLAVDRDAEQ